jgi:dTDP-4-dehydrorhamnose 3,5-epimerase
MQITETSFPEVLLLEPNVIQDDRGFSWESFNRKQFAEKTGLTIEFVQDIQYPQGRLVRVVRGSVFDVVVDIRRSSRNFGRWIGMEISETNRRQLWIPPRFAHGFLVTSDSADFIYKTTDYWHPEHERCICWNDPSLAIDWPLNGTPILSRKDTQGMRLIDAEVFA